MLTEVKYNIVKIYVNWAVARTIEPHKKSHSSTCMDICLGCIFGPR